MNYSLAGVFFPPIQKINQGESIVIYGYGNVGRQYIAILSGMRICHILFAVDANYDKIEKGWLGVEVKAPKSILSEPEARILLAIGSRTVARQIMGMLKAWGIAENRIIYEYPEFSPFPMPVAVERKALDNYAERERYCDYFKELHSLLITKQCVDGELVRVGGSNDGGYVMSEAALNGGIAYSFGINDDVAWDSDMVKRGYDIYMYDHTISALPEECARFHFDRKGISAGSISVAPLFTLEDLLRENGHSGIPHMVLKMDVEGAEWGFLHSTSSDVLQQFDQIVFELHGLLNLDKQEEILAALRKINATHQLVHIHANNYANSVSWGELVVSDAIEVSYIRRGICSFFDWHPIYPLTLDAPCWKEVSELVLGNWNGIQCVE